MEKIKKDNYQISNPKDDMAGAICAILFILGLYLILISFEYKIADPPPTRQTVKSKIPLTKEEIKQFEIVETNDGGGGSSAKDPVNKPDNQAEEIITGKKENKRPKSDKGKEGNKTDQGGGNNLFDGQGGDGTGDEFGGGHNGSSANDPGKGLKPRILLVKPKTSKIYHSRLVKIHLKVKINPQGRVISASNIASQTTTTDQSLINQVINETKNTALYDKRPGAPTQGAYITITIQPR